MAKLKNSMGNGESLGKIKDKVGDSVETLIDSAKSNARKGFDQAIHKGAEMWEESAEKREKLLKVAMAKGKDEWEKGKKYVQKKPDKAIGLIFLTGFIIGAWIFTRD